MVTTQPVPHVPEDQRVVVRPLGHGVSDVVVRYGFMEDPNVPEALARAREQGLEMDQDDVTYFLGRETLIVTRDAGHGGVAGEAVRADGAQRCAGDDILQAAS